MSTLKQPLITEKMNKSGEKLGQYGFIVDVKANKIQIKQAIEKMYNVNVERVNTMCYAGKLRNRYTKTGFQQGNTGAYKKAVVTLKKGESIDFYSSI
ncbi:MAG: 50S ribosomal protein L23 [Bacteroidia bacterium]|nr:50S ribosomal protein L23 [Bacteroidia bacterium]